MFNKINILLLVVFVTNLEFCTAKHINWIVDDHEDCRHFPDLRFNPKEHVYFSLYTRENHIYDPHNITIGNITSLLTSNYNLNRIIKIHVHGVCGVPDINRRLGFLNETPEINVIMVNWNKGSTGSLSQVARILPDVGREVAIMIDWLVSCGVSLGDIHLLGSSMGSHIVGFAGRNVKSGLVPYINACDPPVALIRPKTDRLSSRDAAYVEVIHTNGARYGIHEPLGHADFYPNWGYRMTGCKNDKDGVDFCSHMRACLYYFESLGTDNFKADKCKNYNEIVKMNCTKTGQLSMGGQYPKNATGVYYLETYGEAPYHKG